VAKPTDSSGNSLSIGLEPGFLTIESRQQGDGDGKDGVAILDALIAPKIFVGLIEYDPVLHNVDMEPADGRVTPEDARKILVMVKAIREARR